MPSVAKQRRTWFALLKEHGVPDEDRHDVQVAHTGKPSLRDWTADDFNVAIAALQRAAGQHRDARAHGCEDEPRAGAPPGIAASSATPSQAGWIEDLCDRVDWKKGRQSGPRFYACSTVLRGDPNASRRRQLRDSYDGLAARTDRQAAWLLLTRREASDLIKALRRAAVVYPLSSSFSGH